MENIDDSLNAIEFDLNQLKSRVDVPESFETLPFNQALIFALVITVICVSIAAGQEPEPKKLGPSMDVLISLDDKQAQVIKQIPREEFDKQFRPRPTDGTVIPNGVDVPRLIDAQPPTILKPQINEEEVRRFLALVAEVDAKRQTTFGAIQPYLAGGMLGAAFLLVLQAWREWFMRQGNRDAGLVK